MKSFRLFLVEDAPDIEHSSPEDRKDVTRQLPKDNENLYSLGSMKVDDQEYHFHGFSENKSSPYKQERFHSGFITVKNPEGNHKVVGVSDFYEENESDHYSASFPKLNKKHSGKGLMSELYKRWADKNQYTLVSGKVHTKGGKNIWAELSQKGTVHAINADRPNAAPIVYDSNNPKHIRKFYKRSNNYFGGSPRRWTFRYRGTG